MLTCLFILFVLSCGDVNQRKANINSINASSFSIFNPISGASIPLSASKDNICNAFGKPVRVVKGIFHDREFLADKWIYKGAVINIANGRMCQIKLNSPAFVFSLHGTLVKVGENISKLQPLFPTSFIKRSAKKILVGLHYNGEPIESYLQFDYNTSDEISSISLTE